MVEADKWAQKKFIHLSGESASFIHFFFFLLTDCSVLCKMKTKCKIEIVCVQMCIKRGRK